MQFTSNIIVALLLAVSTPTVTAAQKSANLRGGESEIACGEFEVVCDANIQALGVNCALLSCVDCTPWLVDSGVNCTPGSNLQEEKAFSDPSSSGLSSIMNDAANPPLPNIDRSLVEGVWDSCPGLDYKTEHSECVWWDPNHNNCTNTQIVCWSVMYSDCYCH